MFYLRHAEVIIILKLPRLRPLAAASLLALLLLREAGTKIMIVLNSALKVRDVLTLLLPRGLIVAQVPPFHKVQGSAITHGAVVEHTVHHHPLGADTVPRKGVT